MVGAQNSMSMVEEPPAEVEEQPHVLDELRDYSKQLNWDSVELKIDRKKNINVSLALE